MKSSVLLLLMLFLIVISVYSEDIKLETIGILGGQNLYLTYTSLGLLFDSYDRGVYDADFTLQLSRDITSSCRKSKSYIQSLLDKKILTGNDLQFGNNMLEAYDNLIFEANSIISIVEAKNSDTLKQYQRLKNKAWEKIQSLLNIEE